MFGHDYTWTTVICGLLITIFVALVVIGGLKRVSMVSQVVVPFMAILYVLCVLVIIVTNITKLPSAIVEIVEGAFGIRAAAGGALGAMMVAMQRVLQEAFSPTKQGLVLHQLQLLLHRQKNQFVRAWLL